MSTQIIPISDQDFNRILEIPTPAAPKKSHKKKLPLHYQGSILGETGVLAEPLPSLSQNKAVAWDWIQYSAVQQPGKFLQAPQTLFKWKEREKGTENYVKAYDISVMTATGTTEDGDTWEKCAFMEVQPRVGYIDSSFCLIKMENKFLYQDNIDNMIELMNEHLNVTFKNYTRIDACVDFQSINYTGSTQQLLRDAASGVIKMKAKSMNIFADTREITGIRWGSRNSGACVTLYNKTKYMRKPGQHKPWIFELWKEAGFTNGIDTYRLEFSMKKNLDDIIDEKTGENHGNHCDIHYINNIDRFINWAYYRHFILGIVEPKKKFKDWKKINPLTMKNEFFKAVRLSDKSRSTNYIKCQVKNTIEDAVKYQDNGEELMASTLFDYSQQLVDKYYLQEWFDKKFGYLIIQQKNKTVDQLIDEKAEHLKRYNTSRMKAYISNN